MATATVAERPRLSSGPRRPAHRIGSILGWGATAGPPARCLLGTRERSARALVEVPEPDVHEEEGDFIVRGLRDGDVSDIRRPVHPFDAVGWKCDLAPLGLSAED